MTDTTQPDPIFEETQDLPWPFAALGLGSGAAAGAGLARGAGLLLRFGAAAAVVGGAGLLAREFLFPMTTAVYPKEIRVRFGRRTRFRIPLKNVTRAYARRYRPLAEFGGWGIRFGMEGRAFNMRGNEGVQLELRSGQRILIGSQRAEELEAAIRRVTDAAGRLDAPPPEPEPAREEAATEEPAGTDEPI